MMWTIIRNLGRVLILLALGVGSTSARAQDRVQTEFTFPYDDGPTAAGNEPVAMVGYHTPGQPLTWGLYGTTRRGGAGSGVAYKLTPPPPGTQGPWKETILHTFTGLDATSGGSGLTFDRSGAAYGVSTSQYSSMSTTHSVSVYKLTPPAAGQTEWQFTALHGFACESIGTHTVPTGYVIVDASGAVYGTTFDFPLHLGTVFKLSPPTTGSPNWTCETLYNTSADGGLSAPFWGLVTDSAGALYGTTMAESYSGFEGADLGKVFKLTPPSVAGGAWTYQTLHAFTGAGNEGTPSTQLVLDASGALYGGTEGSGADVQTDFPTSPGSIYKLSPPAAGQTAWTKTTLYSFPVLGPSTVLGNTGTVGLNVAGLIAVGGALYGSTYSYGDFPPYSSVFKLTPPVSGHGAWSESTLAAIMSFEQVSGLIANNLAADANGNLYSPGWCDCQNGPDVIFKVFTQPK